MRTKSFTLSLIAAAALITVGAAPAMAQNSQYSLHPQNQVFAQNQHNANTNTPAVDATQQQLHARIQQGIASGQLTQAEATALYQREREIQNRESRMKQDGNASPDERRQLRQDLDNMRAEVEQKLANRQVTQPANTTPGVNTKQQQIHARIVEGTQSGRITRREADKLFAKEKLIVRQEARFKADGRITRSERQTLQTKLASLSREVERTISNRHTR